MIDAEYKRDIHNNYMVIKEEDFSNSYDIKMLQNNDIPGLVHVEFRVVDNVNLYYYDITAKQPIILLFEKNQLRLEQINKLIRGIINGIEKGREFLLAENNFVLDPQYLYISLPSFEINLCYIRGYNQSIPLQLCHLVEFLMNKVDHKDEEAVLIIYALYKCSREDNCTIDKMLDILEKKRKIILPPLQQSCIDKEEEDESLEYVGEERIEDEEEIYYFPKKTIVSSIVSAFVVLLIVCMILKNGGLNSKVNVAICLLMVTLEGYYINKMFSKGSRVVDVQTKVQFAKPKCNNIKIQQEEMESSLSKEETVTSLNEEYDEGEKTTLLGWNSQQKIYKLCAENKSIYEDIILTEFPFFIGKLKTNVDYAIENNLISRYHAKIELENSTIYLWDLNSTNGTYVNNVRVDSNQRYCLAIGDVVMFADIRYRFTFG